MKPNAGLNANGMGYFTGMEEEVNIEAGRGVPLARRGLLRRHGRLAENKLQHFEPRLFDLAEILRAQQRFGEVRVAENDAVELTVKLREFARQRSHPGPRVGQRWPSSMKHQCSCGLAGDGSGGILAAELGGRDAAPPGLNFCFYDGDHAKKRLPQDRSRSNLKGRRGCSCWNVPAD